MAKQKSARHHWWPEWVSGHWADTDGFVHWLRPTGEVKRIPPKQLGAIGNGHTIKLARRRGEESPWDESFESQFDRADSAFPALIFCLQGLERAARQNRININPRKKEESWGRKKGGK